MSLVHHVRHMVTTSVKAEVALHVLTWKDKHNILLSKKSMMSLLLRNYTHTHAKSQDIKKVHGFRSVLASKAKHKSIVQGLPCSEAGACGGTCR